MLAANAVLMHFIAVAAFFLDGLAFAAEALVGKAVGAANRAGLTAAARMTTWWAAGVALSASIFFAALGTAIIDALTIDQTVRAIARTYLPWAAAGASRRQYGASSSTASSSERLARRQMRNAMLLSLAIFLVAWWTLTPFGNHGLWASLYVLYAARTATLGYQFPALVRSVPA